MGFIELDAGVDDWFDLISAGRTLSGDSLDALRSVGFVIILGPIAPDHLTRFACAYDSAVERTAPEDISVGSTTTRVKDFVNRGAEFDSIYVYEPILEACCHIIGEPFKLSTLHARTVRPYTFRCISSDRMRSHHSARR